LGETIDRWARTALPGRQTSTGSRTERAPHGQPAAPSGPKLRITAAVAAVLEPLTPSRPVQARPAPPRAVPVTPTRKRSEDPVGDLDRLERYFTDLARWLGAPGHEA
jgi:hypothetical protein